MKLKSLITGSLAALMLFGGTGCQRDADIASRNLSKAADNFEVNRRIVFYNGITADYMLVIEGKCALEPDAKKVTVTCKIAPDAYKKHYLGLSDNVTYFAEHLESTDVSVYHHRITFKPQSIIPEIELKYDHDELINDRH